MTTAPLVNVPLPRTVPYYGGQRLLLAYHEGGHAVVAHALGATVRLVTTRILAGSEGACHYRYDVGSMTVRDRISLASAGMEAERRMLAGAGYRLAEGTRPAPGSYGCSDARNIRRALLCALEGERWRRGVVRLAEGHAAQLTEHYRGGASEILGNPRCWALVERVAAALLEREELGQAGFERLLRPDSPRVLCHDRSASYVLSNPYPRQARGRFGFGGPGQHGHDASAGGGRRIAEATHALEQAKAELAAAQGAADRLRAMPAHARPADQVHAVRNRYGHASGAVREAATALEVAHGGTGVQIDYVDTALRGGREAVHTVFGRDLSSREMVDLAGARPNDSIVLKPSRSGFEASVAGPSIMRAFEVRTEADGTITLEDHYTRNQGERTTQSGQEIVRGLQAAERLGVDRIMAQAARGGDLIGYRVWTKIGFDGPIPTHVLGAARQAFGHDITKVSDILTRPGGRAWWKANGTSFNAVFDFHSDFSRTAFAHWVQGLDARAARGDNQES